MGVFMVVRAGVALVGRIPEMLVSYRWAPTKGPLSNLVQMTDAGSVPSSATITTKMAPKVTTWEPFFCATPPRALHPSTAPRAPLQQPQDRYRRGPCGAPVGMGECRCGLLRCR